MAFSPRQTKIRPELYAVDSKDFSKLLVIASQMIDPTNDPSSDAYQGVKIDRGNFLSCFRSSTRSGSHFSRKNWSTWLWSTGWVDSRLEIPLLQETLIINKYCVLVHDSDDADQQKFVVSKRIQKAVRSKHGLLGFGEWTEPVYLLDDGNDGTLYSFGRNRRKGDSNNQVRLSSQALHLMNLNRGYYVSKTNKTVPPTTDLKSMKKKKKKKKNATSASMDCEEEGKILYLMHRHTIEAQQYNICAHQPS